MLDVSGERMMYKCVCECELNITYYMMMFFFVALRKISPWFPDFSAAETFLINEGNLTKLKLKILASIFHG
jgi:hypothetical protein